MKFPVPDFSALLSKLPALPGRKVKKRSVEQPLAPVGEQTASLGNTKFMVLAIGVVLLVVSVLFVFQIMAGYATRAMQAQVEATTGQAVAHIGTLVEFYGGSLGKLSNDPEIARLLKAGNDSDLQAMEERLLYYFPGAINIRLLPPGLDRVDKEASPPLGYAAIAQMRNAETKQTPPPAEVHLFNTPQQHINLVRRVMDPAGQGVVGHIMLSLSDKVIRKTLADLQELDGYIELQQRGIKTKPVVILGQGDKIFRLDEPASTQGVKGSLWQVAYWPSQSLTGFVGKTGFWALAVLAIAVGVFVVLMLVLFKRITGALHQDQVSLVTLLKDYRDQRVRGSYTGGLVEMNDTIEFMTLLANKNTASESSGAASREQDEKYGPDSNLDAESEDAPVEDDFAASFSTLPDSNVVVEGEENETPFAMTGAVSVDPSIFRAYDIRGVVNQTLTAETVELIGRSIGSEAIQRGRDTVIVGRDGRLSGPLLSAALIRGLMATGCGVKDIGEVPTPALYFATHYLDTLTGVVVTGSHNPPDYNGLKIMIDGESLSGDAIQWLRERIDNQNFISGQSEVEKMNILPYYIERICGDIEVARPMKIVVDCGNGVAGAVAPKLFKALGCDVIELFCEVDGNFPNHHPDPSKPENLKELIKAVADHQADIGLAFDGDGDRLGIISSAGDVIWPDRVLMMFATDVLSRNPGGLIIYDVKCTRNLDGVICNQGGEPLMWKTGHSFIKSKMQETGALLAGEMSGHIFFKERWYGFDDGLYAAARLLEILSRDSRKSSAVFAELPDSVNTPELNIQMQEGEPGVFIDQLLASAHFEDARVSTIDGLRADFDDGWGLVRASNTTPVLVIRFEADNEAGLTRIMGEFRRVMLQVKPDIPLPF
jgi:phosphomannomutase/phosphoglucomutase